MATLEELRSRLASAEDLGSVVKTMQAMAAVNLRQFRRAAESLGELHRTIEMGLTVTLRERPPAADPETPPRPDRPPIAILVGADQGMTGPFNDRVADRAAGFLDATTDEGRRVVVIGERLEHALADHRVSADRVLAAPGTPDAISEVAEDILVVIEGWHGEHGAGPVVALHACPTSGTSYEIRELRLLPVDPDWLASLRTRSWPSRRDPMVAGEPERTLAALIRLHAHAILFRALAESLAAENAARLAAMQSAQRSIEERTEELAAAVRHQRQKEITEELLDIVAGFEALESGSESGT